MLLRPRAVLAALLVAVVACVQTPASETIPDEPESSAVTVAERRPSGTWTKPFVVAVADADAQPIADAIVEIWPTAPGASPVSWLTAADGTARIDLPRLPATVFAHKDGVGTSGLWARKLWALGNWVGSSQQRHAWVPRADILLELRPVGRLSGQVLWRDGVPEPGALITVENGTTGAPGGSTPRPIPAVKTDSDGRFDVEVDAPFFGYVTAMSRGARSHQAICAVLPAESDEVVIRFPGSFGIQGHVVDRSGAPIAEAQLKVWSHDVIYPIEVRSRDDGSFRVDLAIPGEYAVHALRSGWVEDERTTVEVASDNPVPSIQVTMVEESFIEGTVLWSTGEPATRKYLLVRAERAGEAEGWANLYASDVDTRKDDPSALSSDQNGRFRFAPVHPEKLYTVTWGGPIRVRVPHVAPGRSDIEIVIDRTLASGARLTGTVTDMATGDPIPRFRTSIAFTGFPTKWHDNPQGTFRISGLDLARERAVVVDAVGYAPGRAGPIHASLDGTDLNIRLGHPGGLRARVVGADGNAVQGATMRLWSAWELDVWWEDDPLWEGQTDTDGLHTWSDLPPEDYWIVATSGSQHAGPQRVSIASGLLADVTLQLGNERPRGTLDVTVLVNGEPATRAFELLVESIDDPYLRSEAEAIELRVTTDDRGRAMIEVEPGVYVLGPTKPTGEMRLWRYAAVPVGATVPVHMDHEWRAP